jgi:23S rRNA (adenine2503-C2)-methyltransferase
MAAAASTTVKPLARFPEEWTDEVVRLGGRAFHGKQVFKWIHARGVTDAGKMSDLPAELREKLVANGLSGVLTVVNERRASDDTRKLLVALNDGANVETVLIPRVAGGRSTLPSPVEEDADAAAVVED